MNNTELVAKVKNVAENFKTLYVYGCFGAPMTAANKKRYINHTDYNRQATRMAKINASSVSTFGFDCIGLIKAMLWGWDGSKTKTYGGAKYAANQVPDINADGMIAKCKDVSTDFSKIEVGEVVWQKGHIGVYIGDGLAVEATPKWKDGVQITAVANIGKKSGYNARTWTKHGKLPYIEYVKAVKPVAKKSVAEIAQEVLDGKWYTGAARKAALKKAGYDYDEVQKKVNELLTKKAPVKTAKKSVTEIAKEVIAGKWGTGTARKNALIKAGYDYNAVQKKVNELL